MTRATTISLTFRTRWLGILLTLGLWPVAGASAITTQDKLLRLARAGDVAPLQARYEEISDPAARALAQLEVEAAHGRASGTRSAMARYLKLGDLDVDRAARAWSLVTGVAFSEGRFRDSAEAAAHWNALLAKSDPQHEAADAAQAQSLATLLASAPSLTVLNGRARRIVMTRDKAGLLRSDIDLNGMPQSAVFDTGANVCVVSASAAAKLHLRVLSGYSTVGSSSRRSVPVKLGIGDRMKIAGYVFKNVPFIILDDRQLQISLSGGYQMETIIGYPIFRAMGAITFGHGYFEPTHSSPSRAPDNLTVQGGDLFVRMAIAGHDTALHLDTGAATSELSTVFVQENPSILTGLKQSSERIGSAGGATTHMIAHYADAPITIAKRSITLPDLAIESTGSLDVTDTTLGTLGQDILSRFSSYTIDLKAMRFSVEAPQG